MFYYRWVEGHAYHRGDFTLMVRVWRPFLTNGVIDVRVAPGGLV